MAAKKRVYKKGAPGSEYDAYQGTPAQRKRNDQRKKARREAEADGKVSKGDGKEVHHVGAKRTGDLPKKTEVTTKKRNRSIQPKRGKK